MFERKNISGRGNFFFLTGLEAKSQQYKNFKVRSFVVKIAFKWVG